MQVSLAKCNQLLRAIAPAGNFCLLLLLQELRHQGLTFIAFYALQRIIETQKISEFHLRRETGLENYEISRGFKLLASSKLIEISRYEKDRRSACLLRPVAGFRFTIGYCRRRPSNCRKGYLLTMAFTA